MNNFADRLVERFIATKSILTVGLDPIIKSLPSFILKQAQTNSQTNEEFLYKALTSAYIPSMECLGNLVAACKPNIAFFEQYGLGGLRAYSDILHAARRIGIPTIADAKRGDIGSTAEAYAAAFLSGTNLGDQKFSAFEADSLTVNPFLGVDTLEVFVKACEESAKGIFVLVKTSNPGSDWIQSSTDGQQTISEKIAFWLGENAHRLMGKSGISALGAVVGATYPSQAKHLRSLMKTNLFLIPGFGAQGGAASDAVAGFARSSISKGAASVNVSRGLFSVFSKDLSSLNDLQEELVNKANSLNQELNACLGV